MNNEHNEHNMISERADLLISHVVDGEATAEQWRELEALAAQEPRVWRELAETQRDAAVLRSAMRGAGDLADRVSLPDSALTLVKSTVAIDAPRELDYSKFVHPRHAHHPQLRLNRLGAWTGWAAAAIVTIIASVQLSQNNNSGTGNANGPAKSGIGEPIVQKASDLFDQYLATGKEDGSVLGEVPGKMLVESRPAPSGQGYEIIFVRQVVERAIVPDLYKIDGTDDRGQATLARYRQPVRKTL